MGWVCLTGFLREAMIVGKPDRQVGLSLCSFSFYITVKVNEVCDQEQNDQQVCHNGPSETRFYFHYLVFRDGTFHGEHMLILS